MHDVTLRPSAAEDVEWIADLRAIVLRDDLGRLGRYDAERVRERFRRSFVPQYTQVIVIDGVDRGSVAVRPEEEALWLEHFYLDPAVQGVGIGSAVLRVVLQQEDARPLRLNVLQGSPARRLYERFGFTLDAEDAVDVWMTRA